MQLFKKVLLSVSLALLPALQANAFAAPPLAKNEVNLVLLEVRLGRHLLSDGVTAYQYDGDIFLPLGELSRLLTLAVRTVPGEGRASGYLLSEQHTFNLDVLAREVVIEGRREPLDRALVKLQAEDIYVASRLLARWLPVDLDVDLPSLSVNVRPRQQLPVQAGLERLERGKQLGSGTTYVDPGYPRQANPYQLADVPFIDQTLGTQFMRGAKGGHQADLAYTAYLTSDLLGMQSSLFASRSTNNPQSGTLRLTIGRQDPDAGLLGPLRARTVLVGSVQAPGINNISLNSATGNGITVGNRPLYQPSRFDRHSLQGDLPPGWDVELYFNEALVAVQQSRADGKYSFDDQPLVYGPNDFRLVFHGPLGQLRVERQSFMLEQSAVAPGQLYYNLTAHRDAEGRARSVAQFDWGLASFLSATGGLARLPVNGVEQRYANLGLHSYWPSFILSADAAQAANGGKLGQLTLKTRLAGLALSASRARLNDFTSEAYNASSDPVRARDELRADGALNAPFLPQLPISLQARRDTLVSNAENIEVLGRVSVYKYGTAVSNSVRWQSLAGHRVADNVIQVSRRVAGIGISGQVQYAVLPQAYLSTLTLAADRNLAGGYLLNLGMTRSFQDKQYRATGALNKSLGSYGLGINGFYTSRHEFGAGIQLFVAMGLEPRQSRWMTDAQPMASMGAASIRVFLDKNQNGVMDGDDEPIKGAGFTINGANNLARTDDAGIAYLNRLPANLNVDIGFDPSSLEDPQWVPRLKGLRVVPRPGKVAQIDFAVSVTGEVDGTTYLMVNDVKRAIGDLQLELVDTSRKVVANITSTSDGYYVIPGVLPGNYLLRISVDQLKRLSLTDTGMHLLTIAPDGTSVNARDFFVLSGAQ